MPYRPPDPRSPAEEMEIGDVYVLHFSKPVGNQPHQQAQHYIGWTAAGSVDARVQAHREKRGGKLPKFAVECGAELIVADVYAGVTRDFERRLKGRGARVHCSICRAETAEKQAAYLAANPNAINSRKTGRKKVAA